MIAEIAPFTLNIPTPVIYAAIGIPILGTLLFLLIRRIRKLQAAIAQKQAAQDEKEKLHEKEELEKLFPQPWLWAYNECPKVGNHVMRAIWFKKWTSLSGIHKNGKSLPKLLPEAMKKFAQMIAQSSSDGDFKEAAKMLFHYLEYEPTPPLIKPSRKVAAPEINAEGIPFPAVRDEIITHTMQQCRDIINEQCLELNLADKGSPSWRQERANFRDQLATAAREAIAAKFENECSHVWSGWWPSQAGKQEICTNCHMRRAKQC